MSALRGRVDVAGAAHGLDDLRLGRIALDLAADAGDADVDAAVEGLPVAIVREVQELVAGQHAVGVVRAGLQQVELPAGPGNVAAVAVAKLLRFEVASETPEG